MKKQLTCTLQVNPAAPSGVSPNVVTYTSLMSLLQRAGQHKRAVALFAQMERDGVAADVTAYNAAMAACAKNRDWQRAWSLFSSACCWCCVMCCIF